MKVKELKDLLENLGPEADELDVEFGAAYPNMPVETIEEYPTHIEIGM